METKTQTTTIRVTGTQLPGFVLGRPRAFWATALAPKNGRYDNVADDASIFDVGAIEAHLDYMTAA